MKRLFFDHLRRRAWLLGVGGLLQISLGWMNGLATGETNFFEGLGLQIGCFLGAFLLWDNMRHGLLRTLLTLPLTPREIGRAGWLAGVAVPTGLIVLPPMLGAGLCQLFTPGLRSDWPALIAYGACALPTLALGYLVLLPVQYAVVHGNKPGTRQRWTPARIVKSLLYGIGICIWFQLACGGESKRVGEALREIPFGAALAWSVGIILGLLGWSRADVWATSRTPPSAEGPAMPERTGSRAAPALDRSRAEGLSLLVCQSIFRASGIGVGIVVVLGLTSWFPRRTFDKDMLILLGGSVGSIALIVQTMVVFNPLLLQLRHLRTLPLGTGRLAAVLLLVAIVPVLVLGVVLVGVMAWLGGPALALGMAGAQSLLTALAAVMIVVTVGLGTGGRAFAVLLLGMAVVQFLSSQALMGKELPGGQALNRVGLSLVVVAVAFFLVRHLLARGTRAWRVSISGPPPSWWGGAGS